MAEEDGKGRGRVVRVIGPVVDMEFSMDDFPEVNTAVRVERTLEGETDVITCEVAQHIGDGVVRTIALKPTDGLIRGTPVENTGQPTTESVRPWASGRSSARP